jgi:hypothetical protein
MSPPVGVGCTGTYSSSHVTMVVSRQSHVHRDHQNIIIASLRQLRGLRTSPPFASSNVTVPSHLHCRMSPSPSFCIVNCRSSVVALLIVVSLAPQLPHLRHVRHTHHRRHTPPATPIPGTITHRLADTCPRRRTHHYQRHHNTHDNLRLRRRHTTPTHGAATWPQPPPAIQLTGDPTHDTHAANIHTTGNTTSVATINTRTSSDTLGITTRRYHIHHHRHCTLMRCLPITPGT